MVEFTWHGTDAELILRYTCAQCGRTCEITYVVRHGMQMMVYEGASDKTGPWQRFENVWICNDHKLDVDVKVDGAEVKSWDFGPSSVPGYGLPIETREGPRKVKY